MPQRILFIHQNFPGQFGAMALELAKQGHDVQAIADKGHGLPGIPTHRYPIPDQKPFGIALMPNLQAQLQRASAVALKMRQRKAAGYSLGGNDALCGGAGNDFIFTATGIHPAIQRKKPDDAWSPPNGEPITIQGSTWGVYESTPQTYGLEGGGSINMDSAPDTAHGGDGNDHITGGLGNDTLWGGQTAGRQMAQPLTGGAGDDTLPANGATWRIRA